MLQSLRSSVGSIFIKVLFGLLVLSFAVWGIGDSYFGGNVGNTVAEVGDREITANQLSTAFRREVERLRPLNIDEQRARQLGVLDQVLGQIVTLTLFDQAARDMGLAAGENALRQQIKRQFGDIGAHEFQNILRNNGTNEQQFLAQLGAGLMRDQYLNSLTQGTTAPKALVEKLYAWRNERRTATFMTIPVDQASPMREPSQEELETYYKANSANFTAPEYRSLSYVYLDPVEASKDVKISEQKLREIYDERRDTLGTPEKRTVLQMLVPDQTTADKALDRIRGGEDFVKVAKDLAGQDESATKLGTLTMKDLPKQLAEPAFKLSKGQPSDPISGPFGMQILQVTEIVAGATPSFDEAKKSLSEDLAKEEGINQVLDLANRLEEALGGGSTLIDAARDLDIKLHKVDAVDSEGRGKSDTPVAGLPPAPFLKSAFETASGQDSLLGETANGGFFVINVGSITAPALRPLDTVRAEATKDWKADERWKAARASAKKIVERLNGGAKLADIAGELKSKTQTTDAFTRTGDKAPANMPAGLVSQLFGQKEIGKAAMADGVTGVDIAQLTGIQAAAADTDKKGVETISRTLLTGIANDITAQLGAALRSRHNVSINQSAVDYHFSANEPIDAGES